MLTRRRFLIVLTATPMLATGLPQPAHAAPPIWQRGNVAIGGIDPTGYQLEGSAVPGMPGNSLMWRDATWYFTSKKTRDLFEMNPIRYAPRYGGYCAYALAHGALVASDPAVFTVNEGGVYLNQSRPVRTLWAANVMGHIAAASAQWPAILAQ